MQLEFQYSSISMYIGPQIQIYLLDFLEGILYYFIFTSTKYDFIHFLRK